jgi:hypothetical protein
MSTSWNDTWLCAGGFNEVLSQDKHPGPRDRN